MTKEFEALAFIKEKFAYLEYNCENYNIPKEELDILQNALNELKAIKEAKPSEAFKELNEIIEYITEDKKVKYKSTILFDCEIIKQSLLKAQKLEKAWEIVRKKRVDFYILSIRNTVEDYNGLYYDIHNSYDVVSYLLTQEEFDLLKEMLK